jgi:hypothetical protein
MTAPLYSDHLVNIYTENTVSDVTRHLPSKLELANEYLHSYYTDHNLQRN